MSELMSNVVFTVYMNKRDVTPWVSSLSVKHERKTLWRSFGITLFGWSDIEAGASWDVYAQTSGSAGRQECLIRNGVVPAESPPMTTFNKSGNIITSVDGYDYVWRVANRTPRTTVVLSPYSDGRGVDKALESYYANGEISGFGSKSVRGRVTGRVSIIRNVKTMHDAVSELAGLAGCAAEVRLPNYKIQPIVVPATQTYWDVIRNLVAPYKPSIHYNRFSNSLIIEDSLLEMTGSFRKMSLSGDAISELSAFTLAPTPPRRVVLRVNRWH